MIKKHRVQILFCFIGFAISSMLQIRTLIDFLHLQMTYFANRQLAPAFQVSQTSIFNPFAKPLSHAIRFIRLATKPALTSTPVLFVKARAVAENCYYWH
jgi:hypothetical protein